MPTSTPNPNAPSILNVVAKDLNRMLFHGARRTRASDKKTLPLGMLAGQQQVADQATMANSPVQFQQGGTALMTLNGHLGQVDPSWIAAKTALSDQAGTYFNLQPDEINPWVTRKKTLSLPAPNHRAIEDVLIDQGANREFLRLPAAVLHEAVKPLDVANYSPPEITLCWVETVDDPVKLTRTRKLTELPSADWNPAMLLRCPLALIPSVDNKTCLFELKGIPQGERWYLDALGLLPHDRQPGDSLPPGATVALWLEERVDEGDSNIQRPAQNKPSTWTLARRNLTRLGRPGMQGINILATESYPYWADNSNVEDALRLIEMASITNAGGYYLEMSVDDPKWQITDNMTLVIAVTFAQIAGSAPQSLKLPECANAIVFGQTDPHGPEVVRFEGNQHLAVSAYAPGGCLPFGFVRELPDITNKTNATLHDAVGFSRGVQLMEFGVSDSSNQPISCYINGKLVPACEPDVMTPLSPQEDLQTPSARALLKAAGVQAFPVRNQVLNVNDFVTARSIRQVPRRRSDPTAPKQYYYRTTLRYASLEDRGTLYSRLKTGNKLTVNAGFRDLFGNIIHRNEYSQVLSLYYTDPLIEPAEWPLIDFQLSAVEQPSGATTPQVMLQVRFTPHDDNKFHRGDIDSRQMAIRLDKSARHDRFAIYLRSKCSKALLKLAEGGIHSEDHKQIARFEAGCLAVLNRLLNEQSLENADVFKPRSTMVSDSALRLIKQPRAAHERRRLNRLLLEGGLGASLLRAASSDPENEKYRLRRWQEIREQLIGAADDDVRVSLVDQEDAFQFAQAGGNLRDSLLTFVEDVLADPTQAQLLPLIFSIEPSTPSKLDLARLQPLLRLERTKYLPPVFALPWQGDTDDLVRTMVINAVTKAESAVPLALAPSAHRVRSSDIETKEFRAVALQFRRCVGSIWGAQVGITRDRFNEHELWFVPDDRFPSGPTDKPVFLSAKPLSRELGSGVFKVPNFLKDDSTSPFQQFSLEDRPFTKVDYDALGRRVFDALEVASQPQRITGARKAEWGAILDQKNEIARTLALAGDPASDSVNIVPIYANDAPRLDRSNAVRTGRDQFLRDLRNYYRTDTLVQIPLQPPVQSPLLNFYGKTSGTFAQRAHSKTDPAPTVPTFSDFVLSYEDVTPPGSPSPAITFGYDLPPGQEGLWKDWMVSSLRAEFSHVQFSHHSDGDFSPGQWLELVDTENNPVCTIDAWKNAPPELRAIPAIVRRFPKEPVLNSVGIMPVDDLVPKDSTSLQSWDPSILSKWDWSVVFTTEKPGNGAGNDKLLLEIEYPSDDPFENRTLTKAPSWPPRSLLHCLLALDGATDIIKQENADVYETRLLQAVAELLELLSGFLIPQQRLLAAAASADRFVLDANVSVMWPGIPVNSPQNPIIKIADFGINEEPNVSPADPNLQMLHVTSSWNAEQGKVPLLLGTARFQPTIFLERNGIMDQPAGSSTQPTPPTSQDLVYRCGPVKWTTPVDVRQKWRVVPVAIDSDSRLRAVIERQLQAIFGICPINSVAVRVDLKHVFALGVIDAVNPFYIYPTDFTPSDIASFSETIVRAYGIWLLGDPNAVWDNAAKLSARQVIIALQPRNPTLHVGLQICLQKTEEKAPVGRVLLDIDALAIPMNRLDFS